MITEEVMPYGWFQFGYLDEFPSGSVVPLECGGQRLVAWRDSQELRLADAYCPHNGAHLGYGGEVEDDCLRCPFHGWAFDGRGACVDVPYSTRVPRIALRTYQVSVVGDLCYAWFHRDPGVLPLWELPDLDELGGAPPERAAPRYHRTVRMRWQDVGENACDIPHFGYLHHTGAVGDAQCVTEGPYRRLSMRTPFDYDGQEVDCWWTTEHFGPGMIVNRLEVAGVSLLNITSITPIDGERVDYRMSWGPMPDRSANRRDYLVARMFIRRMMSNSDQDIVVFENKVFKERPMLVVGDGQLHDYRRWVAQFSDNSVAMVRPAKGKRLGAITRPAPVEAGRRLETGRRAS